MVLVDILRQTPGRDSCKEHRSFGPVRSGRRVPSPPADRSVCEFEKVKHRSHPDQALADSVPRSSVYRKEKGRQRRRSRAVPGAGGGTTGHLSAPCCRKFTA